MIFPDFGGTGLFISCIMRHAIFNEANINTTIGDGLYYPLMVILGMVYDLGLAHYPLVVKRGCSFSSDVHCHL